MSNQFTEAELEAYLDEALDSIRAAEIEQAAREDPDLVNRLAHINRRRDAGIHTLGEIWRRYQIGVPSREEMADYLLNVLPDKHADYISFRLNVLKCPYTLALYRDLGQQQQSGVPQAQDRRHKFYQSSAGLLKKDK